MNEFRITPETIIFYLLYLLLTFIFGCVAGALITERTYKSRQTTEITRDTVTDTVKYYMPIAKDSTVVRYIVRVLPAVKNNNDGDIPCDTPAVDSVGASVVLPVSQKHYADSLYDAWVSGYEPRLDSIRVYGRTITNTLCIKKTAPRLNIGLQGGYGFTPKGLQPYLGVGVSYRLF